MFKLALIALTVATYAEAYGICYDCYYSPSGYIIGKGGSSIKIPNKAYVCAAPQRYDGGYVGKRFCESEVCFVRKDENGLVYRGCADDLDLPTDFNYTNKCQYLGDQKSLHFFCKGDFCNNGQLGESADLCGSDEHNGDANACNGNCYKNPTGLSPHESDIHYYIQCDAGRRGYNKCSCCEPRVLKCPPGYAYHDEEKACLAGRHFG